MRGGKWVSGRLEDVPDQAFLHFVFIALGYWGLGVGAEDFWLGLDCMQKESCICRLWASSGHWDKATSARTRRWQFGVNVEKWKIQKRGLLSLAIFSSVWRGSGRNGGRGTGLNTVAFVLELKQQTLPMQTLKKCIKRCNKSESKGGVSGGKRGTVAGARGVRKFNGVGTARRSCCNVDLMNISLGQLT